MAIVNLSDVREKSLSQGAELVGSTPAQYAETLRNDVARWGAVIKATGARAD